MNDHNLVIEDVVSMLGSKPSVHVTFLEKVTMHFRLRNNTLSCMEIDKIYCIFETEAGLESRPLVAPAITLEPGQVSIPISIEFVADLSLKASSNYYSFEVHEKSGEPKQVSTGNYLILEPISVGGRSIYISHTTEDTETARSLALFLWKVGFKGYVLEDDAQPGLNLWKEKIPNATQTSSGMIILWTRSAHRNPENVLGEVALAKSFGKHVTLVIDKAVEKPPTLDADYLYHFDGHLEPNDLKNLAIELSSRFKKHTS